MPETPVCTIRVSPAPILPQQFTHILVPVFAVAVSRVPLSTSELPPLPSPHDLGTTVGGYLINSAELESLYVFRDREAVTDLLAQHVDVQQTLLVAYEWIQRLFGSARVSLDVSTEHDRSTDHAYLVASIATDLAPGDAVARLRSFDDDWWLEQPQSDTGLLLFTVE
jgi:hypothetical protein